MLTKNNLINITNEQLFEIIEELIDLYSLERILENITKICEEKAEHVKSIWQDRNLAVIYESFAKKLHKQYIAAKGFGV